MCGCSQALRFLVSGLVRYSVGLGCGVVESGNGVGECRLVFFSNVCDRVGIAAWRVCVTSF